MSNSEYHHRRILRVIWGLVSMFFLSSIAQGALAEQNELKLLTDLNPGPKAIGLTIHTNKPQNRAFQSGDRLIIFLQASKKAYLTVLYGSPQDRVSVVFPMGSDTSGILEGGKLYTLFGDDSNVHLKLGEKASQSRLIFYVTSSQPELGSLLEHKGKDTEVSTSFDFKLVNEAVTKLASDEGFNLVVLPLKDSSEAELELVLEHIPESVGSKLPTKRLPPGVQTAPPEPATPEASIESEEPGSVTGTQGLKKRGFRY